MASVSDEDDIHEFILSVQRADEFIKEVSDGSSIYRDAIDQMSSGNYHISDIQPLIQQRYNKVTSIFLDEDNWPMSYSYYSCELTVPPAEEHSSITIHEECSFPEWFFFTKDVMIMWQKLNEMAKDKLAIVLRAAESVWQDVRYHNIDKQWMKRPAGTNPKAYSSLRYYGKVEMENVLEYLSSGRKKEYYERILNCSMLPTSLQDHWVMALISGMSYGHAREAVYQLLGTIICLLQGFEDTFPKVWIFNITSTAEYDGSSTISSSSSKSSTRSSSPPYLPAKRYKSTNDEGENSPERHTFPTENNSTQKKRKQNRITWPTRNRQFDDLNVVSMDSNTGAVKYLIVVEIHSMGKSKQQAEQNIIREIMHVLQAQNEVFGLFLSYDKAFLYKAKRKLSGSVVIYRQTYSMIEGFDGVFNYFCVGRFQKLVFDLLSCIIYGAKHIDV